MNAISNLIRPAPSHVGQRPPGDVEREPRGGVAAQLRLRQRGEELPDRVEDPEVGRRRRARGLADRRLVDRDHRAEGPGRAASSSKGGGRRAVRRIAGGGGGAREFAAADPAAPVLIARATAGSSRSRQSVDLPAPLGPATMIRRPQRQAQVEVPSGCGGGRR